MSDLQPLSFAASPARPAPPRPWDARLARWLVTPLKDSWVRPNHLTTVRLLVGLAAAQAFMAGGYVWSNVAALLLALSNFLDHTDGELARLSGKSSRIGHLYDLISDATITILLFIAIGIGLGASSQAEQPLSWPMPPAVLGTVAGLAVALVFLLRMRIEDRLGKSGTQQASIGGFETEDVLYLLPLVTVSDALAPFLLAASIGAPLFALWVVFDYRRVMRAPEIAREHGTVRTQATAASHASAVQNSLARCLSQLTPERLRPSFEQQGAFIFLPEFLPPEITAQLIAAVDAVTPAINRNYLPGHKQGGSVSRHTIDRLAPVIAELYRAPALLDWLQQLSNERLQLSPPSDPHAYALYFYTRPGDHIGWHYDTSYYAGRRYTLLLGVIDDSSCRLEYQLHTRNAGATPSAGAIRIPPGGLVFFDGDRLRHRITPLAAGERRVSLTFEYVTDARMSTGWRIVSQMKDAIAYFGFRQVFRRRAPGSTESE